MGRKMLDVKGQRYGRLTIIGEAERGKYRRRVMRCVCDCGNECDVVLANMRNGRTLSCGCYRIDRVRNAKNVHGESRTRLYRVWQTMRSRCHNQNYYQYPKYGGAGITMCDAWANDFLSFKKWAYENGYSEDARCYIRRSYLWDGFNPENCYIMVRDKL